MAACVKRGGRKAGFNIPLTNRVLGPYCKLWTEFFSARIYGPRAARLVHKSERKRRGSVTYSTDRENEVSKIFIISLGSKRNFAWQLKQTFEFSGPYTTVRPAKLTNHSARTKREIY